MKNAITKFSVLFVLFIGSCTSESPALDATAAPTVASKVFPDPTQIQETQFPAPLPTHTPAQEAIPRTDSIHADVQSVEVTRQVDSCQFNVQVSSPDTGCEQYADWWEVLSEDGQLLYRRVLLHSHVNEQSFTRSGGPVPVDADTIVIIRAHMNTGGYGGAALRGSASSGFETVQLESGFAAEVEALDPLPDGCAF